MKKLVFLMLLATIGFGVQAKDLRIGIEAAYPPFSMTKPDGSFAGFDIDIARALCAELKRNCVLVKQNWDGLIPALMARKFDAIVASMSITEERKKKVSFTEKYYSAPAQFIALKGKYPNFSTKDMQGKSVGVQRSTIMDNFVTDNFEKKGIVSIKRYKTQDEASLDLVSGRVDFGFMELVTGGDFLKTKDGKKFEFVGKSYSDTKWFGEGIGIAIRKKDNDLRKQLNQAIKNIRANGTYQKIQSKYFEFDIYGD